MQKLNETARGVFVISVTPFTERGDIDYESVDRLIEFYLACGVDGMTILGMMGEAQKLTGDESVAFARHVLKRVAGRVPVIVGVSSQGFAAMAELTAAVMESGAAGVMVAPPSTLKTDAESSATTRRSRRRSAPTCRSCCRTIRNRPAWSSRRR
jgi:4-hydroxy-tetrahydrodipicolinate synthase